MLEINSNNEQSATFSFAEILKEADGEQDFTHLDEVSSLLATRFNGGSKVAVAVPVFEAAREVLDSLDGLAPDDSVGTVARLDRFLSGVFGHEYLTSKGGIFAEFAVMKAIRDTVGCGVEMPSTEDDMHGVDLWVDISAEEDGSEMLALQIKYTARFGDGDDDPQAIFALLDDKKGLDDLMLYLGVGKKEETKDLIRRMGKMDDYVKMKESKDGAPKYRVAYLALSNHYSWFDKRTGQPNKRLTDFLSENILDNLVYGEQPKGDQND